MYIRYELKFTYKASPNKAQVHNHNTKHEYFSKDISLIVTQ